MKKRITAFLLVLTLGVSLTACAPIDKVKGLLGKNDGNTTADSGDSSNADLFNQMKNQVDQNTEKKDDSNLLDTIGDALSGEKHDVWEGTYFFEVYDYDTESYLKGMGDITVSGDKVQFDYTLDGEEFSKTFTETSYDEAHYDYGDYTTATAQDGEDRLNFSWEEGYTPTISYEFQDKGGSYLYADLSRFSSEGLAEKPANYDDSDYKNYITDNALNDHSGFFTPNGDDFGIYFTANDQIYISEDEKYPAMRATLYNFDVNGYSKDYVDKYIMEDTAAAQRVYEYWRDEYHYDEDEIGLDGKNFYRFYDYSGSTKTNLATWNTTYKNCHYNKRSVENDQYYSCVYFSKPLENLSMMDLDMAKYLYSVPSGDHMSIDTKDCTMSINFYFNSGFPSLDISGYSDGSSFYNSGINRFGDMSVEMMYYDSYNKSISVTEIAFKDTEAESTQYIFENIDFANVDITLDNFKSKNAAKTISHRYDMTRVKQY